jgi:4-hydroxy-tetrahydrodipicolinate reductase
MVIKIGIIGATGRTGKRVVERVLSDSALQLQVAIASAHSPHLGALVEGSATCYYSSDIESLESCDGVIDFSVPACAERVATVCARRKIPLLLATTGLTPDQKIRIEEICKEIPLCITSNTSLGATVVGILAAQAVKLLGAEFDCEVVEMHHKMKLDAPSGTAKMIIDQILEADRMEVDGKPPLMPIFGRTGLRKEREVGVVSLRGGDEAGEHTVYYFGASERIEISHKVKDRAVFAHGAVVLIKRLIASTAGLYTPKKLLLVP